jgi:hypothetical protein
MHLRSRRNEPSHNYYDARNPYVLVLDATACPRRTGGRRDGVAVTTGLRPLIARAGRRTERASGVVVGSATSCLQIGDFQDGIHAHAVVAFRPSVLFTEHTPITSIIPDPGLILKKPTVRCTAIIDHTVNQTSKIEEAVAKLNANGRRVTPRQCRRCPIRIYPDRIRTCPSRLCSEGNLSRCLCVVADVRI